MKKRIISLLMTTVLGVSLCSCGPKAQEPVAAEPTETVEEPAATETVSEDAGALDADQDMSGGTPWVDSDLKDNITEGMEVSAKDDFYLYVNYEWLKNTDIPEGRGSANSFSDVSDITKSNALEVLKDDTLTGHDAELVQSYYNAILDWDARDKTGLTPIEGTVETIRSIDSMDKLSEFICDLDAAMFVPTLINCGNTISYEDAESYIAYINNDGLLLSDPAEYSNRTEMGDRAYEAYLGLSKAMLTRLGYSEDEVTAMYEDVIAFETKIAEVSLTSADQMSPDIFDKINNVYTPDELDQFSETFPLKEFLDACDVGDSKSYIIFEPEVIKLINELYTEDNLETIKNSMLIHYVISVSTYLDSKSYDAYIEAKNIRNGSVGREADEQMAYDMVRGALTTPMDRAYLEHYDASEKKERVTGICNDVIDVYREMLQEEDWLSEETREKAIEKLDSITINAVYPEKWMDFSSMDLAGKSLYDCEKEISDYYLKENSSHTNGKVDHEIWNFDILEANAYYNPQDNSINIILGLLESPFYYDGMSDEELYGGLGAVIGHEISHAFDTNGAQFDKDGNYSMWWTEDDYAAFNERAARLIDYYNGMYTWEGQAVQGNNIQTEAIADMTGMKAMLRIAKSKDDFDYDKFFTSNATIWRRLNTRENEYYSVTQDPHPVHYLRANVTLQQFDEFLDTYGIVEGDGMYLAPEDRVLVW